MDGAPYHYHTSIPSSRVVWHGLTNHHYTRACTHGLSRPVAYKPTGTWWRPTFVTCRALTSIPTQGCVSVPQTYLGQCGMWSTPLRPSHLSGTDGSDRAGRTRRIARLSLPLVRQGVDRFC
ncbi:hypothetical protein C8Q80DRAFT_939915 [Daedaleopsis nitida]|nr:hypothetical protein C8Q80DRAFT_939915 [Daedaleopsis nitida]